MVRKTGRFGPFLATPLQDEGEILNIDQDDAPSPG
jgi:hypothetical protein